MKVKWRHKKPSGKQRIHRTEILAIGTKLRRFAQTMIPLKYRQPQPPNKILSEIEAGENIKSHHTKSVKKFLDEQKVSYLYLPPYSPDLNPLMLSHLRIVLVGSDSEIIWSNFEI